MASDEERKKFDEAMGVTPEVEPPDALEKRWVLTGFQMESIVEDARAQGRAEVTGGVLTTMALLISAFVIGVIVGWVFP